MRDVYTIEENKKAKDGEAKAFWTKVGSAHDNKDGSVNIYLNALPMNGKLQVRERREKE